MTLISEWIHWRRGRPDACLKVNFIEVCWWRLWIRQSNVTIVIINFTYFEANCVVCLKRWQPTICWNHECACLPYTNLYIDLLCLPMYIEGIRATVPTALLNERTNSVCYSLVVVCGRARPRYILRLHAWCITATYWVSYSSSWRIRAWKTWDAVVIPSFDADTTPEGRWVGDSQIVSIKGKRVCREFSCVEEAFTCNICEHCC